jgi:hypothetical protein
LADKILTKEDLNYAGECSADFYSKGLYRITCHKTEESEDFFHTLKSLIIEKHGQPWESAKKQDWLKWRSRDNKYIMLTYMKFSGGKYFIVMAYWDGTMEDECKTLNEKAKYEADIRNQEQVRKQREEIEKHERFKKDF